MSLRHLAVLKKNMSLNANPDSLLGHLIELRNRLLRCVVAVIIAFAALAAFAQDIYHLLAQPLMGFAQATTMTAWWSSGTAQFVALEQWGPAMSLPTLMLAVLAVNARYLLQGAALAPYLGATARLLLGVSVLLSLGILLGVSG